MTMLVNWFPLFILIALWVFFMRQMQGEAGGRGAMSFRKSRARMLSEDQVKVTFRDIAGAEEAKESVGEMVDFLRDPSRFQKLGGKIPKGALMVGPPGTGKTLLARAIAGEAKVPFFTISGSDFVEMFVGVGASRVRDLYEQAKKRAPCIVFIDEIDAVGRRRGTGLGGGHDEREQTLNQLLVEMDGFEGSEGVIVIAATNRPDVLDPALLRPGRFDRYIRVPLPDSAGRKAILQVHGRKVPLADDVEMERIARMTPGFSGADLANLINESALVAARKNKKLVDYHDIDAALDKLRSTKKAKLAIESLDYKWRVAAHEIGHLAAAMHYSGFSRIDSVSIFSPYEPDWYTAESNTLPSIVDISSATNSLIVLLSGRAAEEVLFGRQISSLSEIDLAIATILAYDMVARWGMSDTVGLVNDALIRTREQRYAQISSLSFCNSSIENEVKVLLDVSYTEALRYLQENRVIVLDWTEKLADEEKLSARWIDNVRASMGLRVGNKESKTTQETTQAVLRHAASAKEGRMRDEDHDINGPSNLAALLDAYRRRKDVLERQVASEGEMHAPSNKIVELDDLKGKIAAIERQLVGR